MRYTKSLAMYFQSICLKIITCVIRIKYVEGLYVQKHSSMFCILCTQLSTAYSHSSMMEGVKDLHDYYFPPTLRNSFNLFIKHFPA